MDEAQGYVTCPRCGGSGYTPKRDRCPSCGGGGSVGTPQAANIRIRMAQEAARPKREAKRWVATIDGAAGSWTSRPFEASSLHTAAGRAAEMVERLARTGPNMDPAARESLRVMRDGSSICITLRRAGASE